MLLPQQKRCLSCMGSILGGKCDQEVSASVQVNYINQRRFRPGRTKKIGLEMTLMRLAKVETRVETKMIRCCEVALYQSPENRTKKKTDRRATWHYAALGAGLLPDCPGLRGREKPQLYQTHEIRESRRN